MSRDQVLGCFRNMQYVFEMKIASGGMNVGLTNMANFHTCVIGHVHLILAGVLLPHGELVKLTGDVLCSPCVDVPVGVDPVGAGVGVDSRCALLLAERDVEAAVALHSNMIGLGADLTEDLGDKVVRVGIRSRIDFP